MEYCEQDLASLLDNMSTPFSEAQVRSAMPQLKRFITAILVNFLFLFSYFKRLAFILNIIMPTECYMYDFFGSLGEVYHATVV